MSGAPWERRPGEGDTAWDAFRAYRDLGPERSLRQVVRKAADGRPGRNLALLKRWSARHGWRARVEAWDAHLDDLRRREAEARERRKARTTAALAGRVRAVLHDLLDRDDLGVRDVLTAARSLEALARAAPEPLRATVEPAVALPPAPPEERPDVEEKAASVLAILHRSGVIELPAGSGELPVVEAEPPEEEPAPRWRPRLRPVRDPEPEEPEEDDPIAAAARALGALRPDEDDLARRETAGHRRPPTWRFWSGPADADGPRLVPPQRRRRDPARQQAVDIDSDQQ